MSVLLTGAAVLLAVLAATGGRSTRSRRLRALGAPRPASAAAARHRWGRRRVVAGREAAVVEVVHALAAELRAGHPPGRALEAVAAAEGPLGAPLRQAAVAVRSGGSPGAELREVATLPGCAALRLVAAAWDVTESSGAATADVLERLGEGLDAEHDARQAMAAALAGPRATVWLLAVLPVVGVALGESIGAHPLRLLLHTGLGSLLLAGAVVLDGCGVAWTQLLVRRAMR